MTFEVGNRVHLLNSVGDILYGNRATVTGVIEDIPTRTVEYEILIDGTLEELTVKETDIDIYSAPHLTSAFTMERTK